MKKILASLSLFIVCSYSFAQKDTSKNMSWGAVHKGILAGVGTISVGEMPAFNITNAYITGNLEYYAQRNVSIRGDAFFFVNSLTQNSPLVRNSGIYFGAFYHFRTNSGFDPLIGFQPGWSVTKMVAQDNLSPPNAYYDATSLCPLASVVVGFNFFAEKWFHIQANVRYTAGQYLAPSSQGGVMADQNNISELSFSFGLGFNIDANRAFQRDGWQ